jgi:O-antigen/teichoic acid export membrane protein
VLNILGAEDYGIYNVVAGVVAMSGFLGSSMATASQRYFAFEIGRKNFEQLKRLFSLNLTIYVLISLLVIVLAETVGLWFINNKLIIPPARRTAVLWVYQCALLSFLMTMITTPFMASIIAHENMNIYAYVSILEVILKLLVVYVLRLISVDKLLLYGILIFLVSCINTAVYRFICIAKYPECRFKFYWNYSLFKELSGYIGWNLFGSIAFILKNQGITILLNMFFTPMISAARSISLQLSGVVRHFVSNFTTAINPQIIKRYAANEYKETIALLYQSSRYTFFLVYIISLPVIIHMPAILNIWLKTVPEYTALFARLSIVDVMIESISIPVATVKQATGKIKTYQIVLGSVMFLNLPVSYIILWLGYPPYMVLVVAIVLIIAVGAVRLLFLKVLPAFSIIQFFKQVCFPISFVVLISAVPTILLSSVQEITVPNLLLFFVESVMITAVSAYIFGLKSDERSMIKNFIFKKYRQITQKGYSDD